MKLDKKHWYIIIASVVGVAVIVAAIFLIFGGDDEPTTLPLELMNRTLDEEYDFALVGEGNTALLTGADVDCVCVMYKNGENRYLEIRFTEEGAEKFEDAIDDYDELEITLDGEILTGGVIANPDEPTKAKLIEDYDTIMQWFNKLT